MGELDPGLSATRHIEVADADTAAAVGSGDVPVLATPRVLALAEAACVEALEGEIPEGRTSVGAYAEVEHDKASPVGATIDVDATLIGHHGRRLEFNVVFRQDGDIVARVNHRRVLVDRERFLERCGA
jgi:fluoroacetyl-CoA thioesterase